MIEIRAFAPEDVAGLVPQARQMEEMVSIGDWRVMVRDAAGYGPTWTGLWDGQVIGVAGITPRWPGRAHAWCVLGAGIPRAAWVGIHRAVMARLAQPGIIRLEAETVRGFPPGDRWLRMLGFEFEGVARCYGPGAEDFGRYARVTP